MQMGRQACLDRGPCKTNLHLYFGMESFLESELGTHTTSTMQPPNLRVPNLAHLGSARRDRDATEPGEGLVPLLLCC